MRHIFRMIISGAMAGLIVGAYILAGFWVSMLIINSVSAR